MKNLIKLSVFVGLFFSLNACKKDKDLPQAGTISLKFANKAGIANLKMDGTEYTNAAGETFTVSKFNYYISNIKLSNTEGSTFSESESYHLLQQSDLSSLDIDLTNVPGGSYNAVSFTIGVDSLRNVSGVQSGALDPGNGMFWSWTTGYIMLKLEGKSPQSTGTDNNFQLHAGGFSGEYNTVKTVSFLLPSNINIDGNNEHIHFNADVLKVLSGNSNISFASSPVVMMPGAKAKVLADNYQNMISLVVE